MLELALLLELLLLHLPLVLLLLLLLPALLLLPLLLLHFINQSVTLTDLLLHLPSQSVSFGTPTQETSSCSFLRRQSIDETASTLEGVGVVEICHQMVNQ